MKDCLRSEGDDKKCPFVPCPVGRETSDNDDDDADNRSVRTADESKK